MICVYIHTCTYIQVTRINKKKNHERERDQGGVYGKVLKEERKEENNTVIL